MAEAAKSLEAFTAALQREAQALGITPQNHLAQASPVENYLQMAAASYDGHSYVPGPIEPMNPVPSPAPLYMGVPPQWIFNDPPGTSIGARRARAGGPLAAMARTLTLTPSGGAIHR